MAKKGLLVNYGWCSGCHTCEVACQMENHLPTGQFGIKVSQVGPWEYGEKKWVYDYIPTLTDQCNLCVERQAAGKKPSCVQHCQAHCISIVTPEEACEAMANSDKVMYITK